MKKLLFLAVFLFAPLAFAHPGNTDSNGCHTCRTNCTSWGLSYGEYHCHGGASHSPSDYGSTYQSPVTNTRSCVSTYGYASYDNLDGTCGCITGYEFGTDVLGNKSCVRKKICSDVYGWASVDAGDGKCKCMDGYTWSSDGTKCEMKTTENTCADPVNGYYDRLRDTCYCNAGYYFSVTQNKCLETETCSSLYGSASISNGDGTCGCLTGYEMKATNGGVKMCVLKKTDQQMCVESYGPNAISVGSGYCKCQSGYKWSADRKSCVQATVRKCKAGYVLRNGICRKK